MPPTVTMRIEQRGDSWVVLPEAGDKVLGTHPTKEAAEKQLRAIEASTAMALFAAERIKAIGLVQVGAITFDGVIPQPGAVESGKYDRFTTTGASFKDGQYTEFTDDTAAQIIKNFVARGVLLPMDWRHETFKPQSTYGGQSLARYSALAWVSGGKVGQFGAIAGYAVQPPDATNMGDGLYGFRHEVTPLGQQLIPNVRYLSPAFTASGVDEQGKKIGYALQCVAATDVPFQGDRGDGAPEIAYEAQTMAITYKELRVGAEITDTSAGKTGTITSIDDAGRGGSTPGIVRSVDVRWNDGSTSTIRPDANWRMLESHAPGGAVTMATSNDFRSGDRVVNNAGTKIGEVVNVEGHYVIVRWRGTEGMRPDYVEPSDLVKYSQMDAAARGTGGTMARKMSAALMQRMGIMEGDDDDKAKAKFTARMDAVSKKFETDADMPQMAGHSKHFEEEAARLEEEAKAYEGEFPGDKDGPHVTMRRMANRYSRLAKMAKMDEGGGDKKPDEQMDVDPSNKEQNAAIHIKTGATHSEPGSVSHEMTAKMATMEAANRGMAKQLATLQAAEDARKADAAKVQAQKFEALADAAVSGGYPADARGALVKFAQTDFDAAALSVKPFTGKATGAPAILFESLTTMGGPRNAPANGSGARDLAGPKGPRIIGKVGDAVVTVIMDDDIGDAIEKMADSKDPVTMEKIDARLAPNERKQKWARLVAAGKIAEEEQPHLFEAEQRRMIMMGA